MKQYTLTLKFQVEDPENSETLANVKDYVAKGIGMKELTYPDLITTEVKLEEDESNLDETNSSTFNN